MGKLKKIQNVNGLITIKEITQQPEVWKKIFEIISSKKKDIEEYGFREYAQNSIVS